MAKTDQLARYRTISTVGAGGMAVVLLAEDTLLGRLVALKRMTVVDDRGGLRLRREALIGASISHPNLVSVYDVVTEEDGNVVIVMEYVAEGTLAKALARHGRLAPSEALRILSGTAAGLDAIHARDIVHRDVKPPNILLGAGEVVKLADLGVASMPDHTRITSSGAVVGSLRYMAPEQVENVPSTKAVDVYALAAVAFEALSGCKARLEANPLALAHAIATKPPPDLREAWPAAPPAAAELLRRAMAHDPAQRPDSAGDLVGRLTEILEPQVTARLRIPHAAPRPVPPMAGRSRIRQPVVASAAVAAAAAQEASAAGAAQEASAARAAQVDPSARPPQRDPAARAARAARAVRAAQAAQAARAARAQAARSPTARDRGEPPPDRDPPPAVVVARTGARGGQTRIPTRSRPSRSQWSLGAALLLAALAAAVGVVVLSSGGGTHNSGTGAGRSTVAGSSAGGHRASGAAAAARTHRGTAGGSGSGSPAVSGSPSASGPTKAVASSASTLINAVESFYRLAAAHSFTAAWALADPALRSQLNGYDSFQAGQAKTRSVSFDSARVVSQSANTATVAVRTTSVHTDATQHCFGTVDLVRASTPASWLLHQIHINCS